MTPMKALRSARDLVRGRRLSLFRKLLFLVAVLGLLTVIIVLPVIMTVTSAAPFVLYVVTLLVLPAVHLYLYTLYRELLA
jgi:heme A synthase